MNQIKQIFNWKLLNVQDTNHLWGSSCTIIALELEKKPAPLSRGIAGNTADMLFHSDIMTWNKQPGVIHFKKKSKKPT